MAERCRGWKDAWMGDGDDWDGWMKGEENGEEEEGGERDYL